MPHLEPRHRRAWSQFFALLLTGGVVLGAPSVALGHAIVKETRPTIDEVVPDPPARVVMRFNEPVELSFGAIRVFDTNSSRVDAGEADHLPGEPHAIQVPLKPDLARGTYTVTWRIVSADGHPISEAFVFHVIEPGENPLGIADKVLGGSGSGRFAGALFGVARWLNFGGLLVLGGAVMFLVFVWFHKPAARDRAPSVQQLFSSRFNRIVVIAWGAIVIATFAGYVLQGSVAAGLPLGDALAPDVIGEVAETRYGKVAIAKLAVLAGAVVLWFTGGRRFAAAHDASSVGASRAWIRRPGWILIPAVAIVAALLVTPGLAGHAGTTDPVALNLAADGLHLVAAAAWLGGLVVLVVAAFRSADALEQSQAAATMAPVVARFSDVAVVAVGAIVATGVYRSWVEIGALRALTDATYGWVLIAKLAVFVPLLALGAINNRVTKPRIERAAQAGEETLAPLRRLRRTVYAEVALGAVVLAVTAMLVNLPPAKIEAGVVGPFVTDVRLGSYNLNVLVDPNKVGDNEVHLTARSPQGSPAPIKEVKVLFRKPSDGIGPLIGAGKELAPGHFIVQGRQLSVSGEWQLEVVARLDRFDEERTKLEVTVN